MSDNGLSQAVDLLTMCLGGQAAHSAAPSGGYSEQLKVWAVVDVRECEGDCPVRDRVAQEAGNQFGRILSEHLRLELGLLGIACRATGQEPRELLRQVLVEADERPGHQSPEHHPDLDHSDEGDYVYVYGDGDDDGDGDVAAGDAAEPARHRYAVDHRDQGNGRVYPTAEHHGSGYYRSHYRDQGTDPLL